MSHLLGVSGWESSTVLVGYLAFFASVGFIFVFVNLLVGRFLRPSNPDTEKLEIYECGEPAIGSSFVQFDLRFYVIALVFIIFDVEVAFLFPWSTVFGKANQLADQRVAVVTVVDDQLQLTPDAAGLYRELGVRQAGAPDASDVAQATAAVRDGARQLSRYAALAVAFFFVVLLIGFAYEWRTGALDWVRAAASRDEATLGIERPHPKEEGSPGARSIMSA